MSGGAIWYFPDNNGVVQKISGIEWSDIVEPTVDALEDVDESTSGREVRVTYRRRYRFTIRAEGMTDTEQYRQLRTLCDYLERGGLIALAIDEAKAFAGSTTAYVPIGGLFFIFAWHPMAAILGLDTTDPDRLVAGDLVWIGTPSPDRKSELVKVSSYVPLGTQVLTTATVCEYEEGCLVRSEGFWPILKLDREAGGPLIPTERRLFWGLDLPLVEDLLVETILVSGEDLEDKLDLEGGG